MAEGTDTTHAEPPTEQLVAGTVGDRCVTCGTPLSSDQRYCVNCGERRGTARFTLPADARTGHDAPAAAAVAPRPRSPRGSSGATLVAGVGTLLLAMGVGVLIGHDTANSNARVTQAAAAPSVITVGGGATSATSTNAVGASSGRGGKHGKASKGPSAAVAKKADQAASKVLGSSAGNLPPATVTVGQSGSGPGFNKKTHKFDGSFFGQ